MSELLIGDQLHALNLIRAAGWGIGSSGKTAWATQLPESWGTGVYIAADSTSPRLKSILPVDRKRMAVVIPNGNIVRSGDSNPDADNKDEILRMDWKGEAYDLAQRNWPRWLREQGPEGERIADGMTPGFVIWDGMSGTADNLLAENARMHFFSEKGPTTGSHHVDIDPGKKFKLPQMGDFLMVQSTCLEIIEWNNSQPHHVITLFQEAIQAEDAGKFRNTLFGPCTVGRAGPRTVPNRFDAILYLNREVTEENPEGLIRVQMRQADYKVAGIKTADIGADIPVYRLLEKDPRTIRDFWSWLETLGNPIEQEVEING